MGSLIKELPRFEKHDRSCMLKERLRQALIDQAETGNPTTYKELADRLGLDLLTLRVALAPCVVGYAEIAAQLATRSDARATTNPYRVWIDEYAGVPYQEVAAKARAHLDRLANLYVTPAREAELVTIFKEATRLETDFWEMGWRAGLRELIHRTLHVPLVPS
jgi:hypothetical protein